LARPGDGKERGEAEGAEEVEKVPSDRHPNRMYGIYRSCRKRDVARVRSRGNPIALECSLLRRREDCLLAQVFKPGSSGKFIIYAGGSRGNGSRLTKFAVSVGNKESAAGFSQDSPREAT